ncbi:MAG: tetratricopeptide repeat protein [Chloroflexi bacterium]|nr:tetratricopeptide repeat protein [Chloroflexota bacterium]
MNDVRLEIAITPNVSASLSANSLAVALLLAELYQGNDEVDKAISLLEEIDRNVDASPLTLSLCELYASQDLWDEVIACAKKTENADDVTLETLIWYGRAMQEKGLQQAAAEVFTDALKKKKNRSPLLLREAMYWRAVSYHRLGNTAKAFGEFQKIYADDPDYRDVALRVATV